MFSWTALAEDVRPVIALAVRCYLSQVYISLVVASLETAVEADARHVEVSTWLHVFFDRYGQ